jgi:hypothetical protein
LIPQKDLGYQTPIKSKQNTATPAKKFTSHDRDDADSETEDGTATVNNQKDESLQRLREQLQLERKQIEIERKQFEFEKQNFGNEKVQFENEKRTFQKQKERMEQERMNQSEGTPAKESFSPQKALVAMTTSSLPGESEEMEEKYNKLLKDFEDLRRENIGYQLEIEKGKKTLETEKNVREVIVSLFSHRSHLYLLCY